MPSRGVVEKSHVVDAPGTHPTLFCCLPAYSGEDESEQLRCYLEALRLLSAPCTHPALSAHKGEDESEQLQCYVEARCVVDAPYTSPCPLSLPPCPIQARRRVGAASVLQEGRVCCEYPLHLTPLSFAACLPMQARTNQNSFSAIWRRWVFPVKSCWQTRLGQSCSSTLTSTQKSRSTATAGCTAQVRGRHEAGGNVWCRACSGYPQRSGLRTASLLLNHTLHQAQCGMVLCAVRASK